MASEYGIKGKILSIQSHVVYGYCGNRSATFPLQVLGYEIDCINTVQFSNHTQYGSFKGSSIDENEITQLINGLKDNKLFEYNSMLTGYNRSPSVLTKIVALVKELKEENDAFIYLCDPVMGDCGQFYVPEEMVNAYKGMLDVPHILTPNQFELELLTDIKVKSIETAIEAINILHGKGINTVILSSSDLGKEGKLLCIGSQLNCEKVGFELPKLDANFVGTGDLFAALILGWYHLGMKESLRKTLQTMHGVLSKTLMVSGSERTAKSLELQIVASKKYIEQPLDTKDVTEVIIA